MRHLHEFVHFQKDVAGPFCLSPKSNDKIALQKLVSQGLRSGWFKSERLIDPVSYQRRVLPNVFVIMSCRRHNDQVVPLIKKDALVPIANGSRRSHPDPVHGKVEQPKKVTVSAATPPIDRGSERVMNPFSWQDLLVSPASFIVVKNPEL
ncbi:MAG: hypothetical protein K9N62_06265 [Verrucomicrobia bacterium]|nr:hypothetical protein [Verrucomicrobiota bacterium]